MIKSVAEINLMNVKVIGSISLNAILAKGQTIPHAMAARRTRQKVRDIFIK